MGHLILLTIPWAKEHVLSKGKGWTFIEHIFLPIQLICKFVIRIFKNSSNTWKFKKFSYKLGLKHGNYLEKTK